MVVRELDSRKLKTVVEIPWAEPAPAVAVPPLTAFQRPVQLQNKGLGRKLVPELILVKQALFPVQPLPAFKAPDQLNNPGLRRKLIPELRLIPPVVVVPEQPMTAFTPVEKLDNPGLKRHLRLVPEINRYPPPIIPEQPPTAFLAPQYFIRPGKLKLLTVLPLDQYPITPEVAATSISGRFEIIIPGQTRDIDMPPDDRTVIIPGRSTDTDI